MHFLECQQMSPEKPFATVLIASLDLPREWQKVRRWGEQRKMMSHIEWETDKVRGQTNAHMHGKARHKTIEGLRQGEREQMRTRLGFCHFHMIKQLAIWDVSNKVGEPDRSGYLELNPSRFLVPSFLSRRWTYLLIRVCLFTCASFFLLIYFAMYVFLSAFLFLCVYAHTYTSTGTHSPLTVQARAGIIKCNVRTCKYSWGLCFLRTVTQQDGINTLSHLECVG